MDLLMNDAGVSFFPCSCEQVTSSAGAVRASTVVRLPVSASRRVDKRQGDRPKRLPHQWQLYTAIVATQDGERVLHAFHATMAMSERSMRARVESKLGSHAAAVALVSQGFDRSHPMVLGMVSDAIAEILTFAARDPDSPLASGLDVQLEQRFS